jgi:hypothetical protein
MQRTPGPGEMSDLPPSSDEDAPNNVPDASAGSTDGTGEDDDEEQAEPPRVAAKEGPKTKKVCVKSRLTAWHVNVSGTNPHAFIRQVDMILFKYKHMPQKSNGSTSVCKSQRASDRYCCLPA